ncbi:MAG: COX15/CtaA family protein [Tumebacillaceae bacterium]
MKHFRLAMLSAIAFFFVNLMGFVDTFTASTEGCGKDYPFCNGKLYPDWNNYHAVIEYTHRLIVLIGTVLLLLISVVAWRTYRTKKVKALILFAIGGVWAEATLGALAVYYSSPPLIMAGHIGIALITFAALLNLAYTIRSYEQGSTDNRLSKPFLRFGWFALVYLYLAIYFGAYVASSGDGVFFAGAIVPTETFADAHNALWVDLAHRSIAVGLVLLSVGLLIFAKRERRFVRVSIALFLLVLLQGVSGILLVLTHLSLAAILLHVTDVSLMFGLLSLIGVQGSQGKQAMRGHLPRVGSTV